jgi:hypothetical protein
MWIERTRHRSAAASHPEPMPADRIPVPDAQQVERWTSDDGIRAALPLAGLKNRQLKGYRFGWAERARAAGMPEREAMNHLGHKS